MSPPTRAASVVWGVICSCGRVARTGIAPRMQAALKLRAPSVISGFARDDDLARRRTRGCAGVRSGSGDHPITHESSTSPRVLSFALSFWLSHVSTFPRPRAHAASPICHSSLAWFRASCTAGAFTMTSSQTVCVSSLTLVREIITSAVLEFECRRRKC